MDRYIVEIGPDTFQRPFHAEYNDQQRAEWCAEDFGEVRDCVDDSDPSIVAEILTPQRYEDGSTDATRLGVIRRVET